MSKVVVVTDGIQGPAGPGVTIRTTAEWEANDDVLGRGRVGYDSDTATLKIGDGVTAWSVLPGISGEGGGTGDGLPAYGVENEDQVLTAKVARTVEHFGPSGFTTDYPTSLTFAELFAGEANASALEDYLTIQPWSSSTPELPLPTQMNFWGLPMWLAMGNPPDSVFQTDMASYEFDLIAGQTIGEIKLSYNNDVEYEVFPVIALLDTDNEVINNVYANPANSAPEATGSVVFSWDPETLTSTFVFTTPLEVVADRTVRVIISGASSAPSGTAQSATINSVTLGELVTETTAEWVDHKFVTGLNCMWDVDITEPHPLGAYLPANTESMFLLLNQLDPDENGIYGTGDDPATDGLVRDARQPRANDMITALSTWDGLPFLNNFQLLPTAMGNLEYQIIEDQTILVSFIQTENFDLDTVIDLSNDYVGASVLFTGQTDSSENGVYVFGGSGKTLQRAPYCMQVATPAPGGDQFRYFKKVRTVNGVGPNWTDTTGATHVNMELVFNFNGQLVLPSIIEIREVDRWVVKPIDLDNVPGVDDDFFGPFNEPRPTNGSDVLLMGQYDRSENGLYVMQTDGSLTRLTSQPSMGEPIHSTVYGVTKSFTTDIDNDQYRFTQINNGDQRVVPVSVMIRHDLGEVFHSDGTVFTTQGWTPGANQFVVVKSGKIKTNGLWWTGTTPTEPWTKLTHSNTPFMESFYSWEFGNTTFIVEQGAYQGTEFFVSHNTYGQSRDSEEWGLSAAEELEVSVFAAPNDAIVSYDTSDWDDYYISSPGQAIYDPETEKWILPYTAMGTTDYYQQIGAVWSGDGGTTWQYHPDNPILPVDSAIEYAAAVNFEDPYVAKTGAGQVWRDSDGKAHIYATEKDGNIPKGVGLWRSAVGTLDGWTYYGRVVEPGGGVYPSMPDPSTLWDFTSRRSPVVFHDGTRLIMLFNGTNMPASERYPEWETATSYLEGDIVWVDLPMTFYRCIADHTSTSVPPGAEWEVYTGQQGMIGQAYSTDDGLTWTMNANNPIIETIPPQGATPVESWAHSSIKIDDIILRQNNNGDYMWTALVTGYNENSYLHTTGRLQTTEVPFSGVPTWDNTSFTELAGNPYGSSNPYPRPIMAWGQDTTLAIRLAGNQNGTKIEKLSIVPINIWTESTGFFHMKPGYTGAYLVNNVIENFLGFRQTYTGFDPWTGANCAASTYGLTPGEAILINDVSNSYSYWNGIWEPTESGPWEFRGKYQTVILSQQGDIWYGQDKYPWYNVGTQWLLTVSGDYYYLIPA